MKEKFHKNCFWLSIICFAAALLAGLMLYANAEEQKVEQEKTEVVLEKVESLEVQNLSKDIRLLQLEAQNLLTQRQQTFQQKIEELKKKYELDGEWNINFEGDKFIKKEKK